MKKEIQCTFCGSKFHYQSFCPKKPRQPIKTTKRPRQIGKRGELWLATRQEWIAENPPDEHGLWYCFYCGVALTIDLDKVGIGIMFMTLDHKDGRRGKLLTDKTRLLPACYPDNRLKGSQDYARFVERYYPDLYNKMSEEPTSYNPPRQS